MHGDRETSSDSKSPAIVFSARRFLPGTLDQQSDMHAMQAETQTSGCLKSQL